MSKETNTMAVYLRDARVDANLTQSEVARKLGYSSPQFVSNWERGLCSPPMEAIPALVDLLSLSKKEVIKILVDETKRTVEAQLFSKKSRRKTRH